MYLVDPNSDLIPAPSWYPAYLPKFYRGKSGNRGIYLRPLPLAGKGPGSETDILDTLLYAQMILGVGRGDSEDGLNVICVAQGQTMYNWVKSAFNPDRNGDGGGNFAALPYAPLDETIYKKLQSRYVDNTKSQIPWIEAMNKLGNGIDITFLPFPTDTELPRPAFYPAYLPSLFTAAGEPTRRPRGFMTTNPEVRNFSNNIKDPRNYQPTAHDVACLMMYAQPYIAKGPTPYPMNWFIDDTVNGTAFTLHKLAYQVAPYTSSEYMRYARIGDIMKPPEIRNPNGDISGILEAVIKTIFSAVPGVNVIYKTTMGLYNVGHHSISASDPPAGTTSAAVNAAADALAASVKKKSMWLIILIGLGAVGYFYRKELGLSKK